MPKHLVSTARAAAFVGLVAFALTACGGDDFARKYAALRAEALAKAANRFGPGRPAGVQWSPPRSPLAGAPAAAREAAAPPNGVTRGSRSVVGAPIEHADLGLTQLVDRGLGATVDQVVEDFELAFPEGQGDPTFLNDFATALLERARPRDLILGGEYAARARNAAEEDDPDGDLARAARFNWALALERLALHGQATAAWQAVLERESDPSWRAEAETHAADLAQWPVARWPKERERLREAAAHGDPATVAALLPDFRTAARLMAEDEELRTWAENIERDPIKAREALAVARTIGQVLDADLEKRDAFLADVVTSIDAAAGDVKRTQELAAAMRGFFGGLEAYKEFDYEAARKALDAAAEESADLGSPLALRAEFLSLLSSDELGLGEVLNRSDELMGEVPSRFAVLRAQVLYNRGWKRSRAGYHERSLADLDESVRLAAGLGEDFAASYGSQWGSTLAFADDPNTEAVDLLWLSQARSAVAAYYRYFVAMAVVFRATYYEPVAPLMGEGALLETSEALADRGPEVFVSETETELYRNALLRGDMAEARRRWQLAERSIEKLRDKNVRNQSRAMLDWAVARNPRSTPLARERFLKKALVRFSTGGHESDEGVPSLDPHPMFVFHQLDLLDRLAQLKIDERDFTQAAGFARKALDLIEARLAEDRPRGGGYGVASEVRPLLTTLLRSELANGTPVTDLFNRSEWAYHLAAPGSRRAATAAEISAALPLETTLIELVPAGSLLMVFVLHPNDSSPTTHELEVSGLEGVVECLDPRARSSSCESWEISAARFAEAAVQPWLCPLERGARLVLVPGPLARVPFAALPVRCPDEAPGRLVERHVTSLSASATSFLEALDRSRVLARGGRARSVLAVGIKEGSDIPKPLDYAPREAQQVAQLYPSGTVILDADATSAAILQAVPGREVLHFATHGEIDRSKLSASYLAVAGGRMTLADLATAKLDDCRLAVLSACDTGGAVRGVEGLVGMSRAFLELGVPTVVATLSDVFDEQSPRLMADFHRWYVESGDAALALAEAQREAATEVRTAMETAKGPTGPPEWAKWVVVGG